MPRSRRNKQVSLTKTQSKGRDLKGEVIEKIRSAVDEYNNIYVFSYENMRSSKFKDARIEWRDSRFFLGKNKLTMVALGRTPEDEYRDGLHKVSKLLSGNVGLLMTSRPKEDVERYFRGFSVPDFARAGARATRTVILHPGKLEPESAFPTYAMGELRRLGLVVEVKDSRLELMEEFVVCKEGQLISPEGARLLVRLDEKLADFQIQLMCHWSEEGLVDF